MSDPKFTMEEVKASIASWVEKQDSFWPEELTSDILTQYALLAFAPHWILDGRASGSWSANIGQDRTVYKTCSHCQGRGEWQGSDLEGKPRMFNCASCNGTGQTSDTVTDWHSQSGVATGHINGKVLENVANDTPIRCGKREFSAEESWLTEPFPDDILIFEPEAVGNETGLELAEKQLRKVVHDDGYDTASGLGQVRNFKLGYVNIESKEARTWLYPIYVSSYKYGEKEYLIEMDGITGKLHIEIPGTVRAKRILKWSAIIAAIVIIGLIFYGISNIILPSTNEYISQLNATATPQPTRTPLPTSSPTRAVILTVTPSIYGQWFSTSMANGLSGASTGGGLWYGAYKYLYFNESDRGKNLQISTNSNGMEMRLELWGGEINPNDHSWWASHPQPATSTGTGNVPQLEINPQLNWQIEPGVYTIFFARHDSSGQPIDFTISYIIEKE